MLNVGWVKVMMIVCFLGAGVGIWMLIDFIVKTGGR